tara:strand:- start:1209 stop:1535 length:327 start_codon:yes stop_codon:yes gene_type:complete
MYKELTTNKNVEVNPSTGKMGKPISKIYQVSFYNDVVNIVGVYEGDANQPFSYTYSKDELPTQEAKDVYDAVIDTVNALHLSLRKSDKNYKTSDWEEIEIEITNEDIF